MSWCVFTVCFIASLCVCSVVVHVNGDSLKVAAFNIQVFGQTKMSKPHVVSILVDIISRYDIVFIQEIRDAAETAIGNLLDETNLKNTASPFTMNVSPRLGRTSSKEQYAFFYREDLGLRIVNAYVFDDGDENLGNDTFEREPYVVHFTSSRTKLSEFVFIGLHAAPGDAVEEIKHLEAVVADAKQTINVNDVMIMGDLNADCSYVPNYKWEEIPMKTDSSYTWLIDDDTDTTVASSACAYDRFIMTGAGFESGYVNGSAAVFRYDDAYGLNATTAGDVSDHYPIVFELKIGSTSASTACRWSMTEIIMPVSALVMQLSFL